MIHKNKWYGAAKDGQGSIAITPAYDDFDTAYRAYVRSMEKLVAQGHDLATFQWRGTWSGTNLLFILTGE